MITLLYYELRAYGFSLSVSVFYRGLFYVCSCCSCYRNQFLNRGKLFRAICRTCDAVIMINYARHQLDF